MLHFSDQNYLQDYYSAQCSNSQSPSNENHTPSVALRLSSIIYISWYRRLIPSDPSSGHLLSSLQQSKLEAILLTSPIQLRTPTAHIGTLYNDTPRQTISALDAFITLKTLIPSGSITPLLPSTIQMTVEIPCTRRCRESPIGSAQISLLGGWSYRDISGCGSLSEGSNVWGFEACDFRGNSVIHLA